MKPLESVMLSYLFNSIWQVPLIFVGAWIASRLLRSWSPSVEHRVWVAALLLEAALPACPALPDGAPAQLWRLIASFWQHNTQATAAPIVVTLGPGMVHSALHLPSQLLGAITLLYAGSLFYFAGRTAYGLLMTRRLRRAATPETLTGEALWSWNRCIATFRIDDAQLVVSATITAPGTVGIRKRLVLLPASMLRSLRQEDFDAAIAHEFAHMHRRDFAKNLLYRLLSLPLAYHPLLWLTQARIVETREMLCDAMAAEAVAGPDRYARSLLRLASFLLPGRSAKTLHAIGIFDANILERRLMNLTKKPTQTRGAQRFAITFACLAVGLGTCTSAVALKLKVATTWQSSEPVASQDDAHRVSAGVMAGLSLAKVQPIYPPDAKAAKISGSVLLHALIGKDGKIEKLFVVSGPQELRKSALDAVHQWTYKPFMLNGEPVEVDTTITVNYWIGS